MACLRLLVSVAYAGETRSLFDLEMDGPTQSPEAAEIFPDGAILSVRITGNHWDCGELEYSSGPAMVPYHVNSPADWVGLESSLLGGDKVEKVPVDTNGLPA